MKPEYLFAFYGGGLIGLAGVLFLLFHGKILGISGIIGGLFGSKKEDRLWRIIFLLGLVTGGFLVSLYRPHAFDYALDRSTAALIIAGLLVGVGTRMGNGCTSGHGVCGISRLSPRSLVATLSFMFAGAVVVFVIERLLGGAI